MEAYKEWTRQQFEEEIARSNKRLDQIGSVWDAIPAAQKWTDYARDLEHQIFDLYSNIGYCMTRIEEMESVS
jgi:hypothetical protein